MSGSQRSKEDDVQKISTHVVDVFIPDRRMKAGKRFAFVRFIKVLDIDRLINNLCTVWMGRNKIHANVADFKGNRYTNKVTRNQVQNVGMEECPNMVLDETCLNHEDFSLCLLGKVNEFASLTNLKVVLGKEGYANIELKYMGGFWVMIVFKDDETKKRFQFNLGVGSWFSQIIQAHNDFVIDERVIWVEVEGVPCKWWSRNTFSRIASRWGTLLNGEELEEEGYHSNRICIRWVPDFKEDGEEGYDMNDGSNEDDMEEVPETNFEEVPDKSIFEGNSVKQNDVHSEDPFGIYVVLNKKRDGKNIDDKHEDSLKYPPRFTPNEEGDVPVEKVDNWSNENRVNDGQEDGICVGQHFHERVEVSNDTHESTCSGHFKKSKVPRKGGSILELMMNSLTWGQTIGYDMTFVIMGDFNEVRDISERFGSIFNKHGAEAFNSFIVNACLVEVPLGGCSFTWCHKSTKKMSKLDWFLIFDNLMCSCPIISSTSLERFLSDHRPIIMREAHYDYGPIPFKFFHYWFELDGFDKKSILKAELADLDGVINKGEGSDVDGHRRREVVQLIQERGISLRDVLWSRMMIWKGRCLKNDDLEREVFNEEIKREVWDCGIDKAPRPDGFTFGFYRWYWDIIGNDVVDAVKWFFLHGEIPKGGNIVTNSRATPSWKEIVSLTVLVKLASYIWKSVLASKDVGGHGVSSLFALNRALMFKWIWRFFSQKNSLWVRVVKALHGEDGKIGKKVQPRYPSTWINIINEIESLKLHGIDLVSFITPKLGNGVNTLFWDVAWCGDIAFKNLVPRLYALESIKNIEVASKLSHGGLEFSFRRNPRGGVEQKQFERLKEMVEGVTLSN
nr:hypothetical protein [Tanacetum cinerariifolium]